MVEPYQNSSTSNCFMQVRRVKQITEALTKKNDAKARFSSHPIYGLTMKFVYLQEIGNKDLLCAWLPGDC